MRIDGLSYCLKCCQIFHVINVSWFFDGKFTSLQRPLEWINTKKTMDKIAFGTFS